MRSVFLLALLGMGVLGMAVGNVSGAEQRSAATILVRLPADAQLAIDDHATTSKSALRRFITPPLERGKTFHYNLKARVTWGPEVMTVEEEVPVWAGEETVVTLEFPEASSRITRIPPAYTYGADPTSTSPYRPASDGAWAGYYGTNVPSYQYGAYSPAYAPSRPLSSRVAPMRDQDPLKDAWPPGHWGTGNR